MDYRSNQGIVCQRLLPKGGAGRVLASEVMHCTCRLPVCFEQRFDDLTDLMRGPPILIKDLQ